nr:CrcB family protein [Leuconostoc gasicomitatum]
MYFSLGAGIGSVIRFLIISYTPNKRKFFTGVFAVNILGSLLIGILSVNVLPTTWHTVIGTGFIGGLTTFSTMMTQGEQLTKFKLKLIYFSITLVFGLMFFSIGAQIKF